MESWHVFYLSSSIFLAAGFAGPSNSGTLFCVIIGTGLLIVASGIKVLS